MNRRRTLFAPPSISANQYALDPTKDWLLLRMGSLVLRNRNPINHNVLVQFDNGSVYDTSPDLGEFNISSPYYPTDYVEITGLTISSVTCTYNLGNWDTSLNFPYDYYISIYRAAYPDLKYTGYPAYPGPADEGETMIEVKDIQTYDDTIWKYGQWFVIPDTQGNYGSYYIDGKPSGNPAIGVNIGFNPSKPSFSLTNTIVMSCICTDRRWNDKDFTLQIIINVIQL